MSWRSAAAVLGVAAVALSGGVAAAQARVPEGAEIDRTMSDPRIVESSGLAASLAHDGLLWTVNDSGDEAIVYGIAADGTIVASVALPDADARDWEALALGEDPDGSAVLWVGDIGDNRSRWPSVSVLRVEEPATLGDSSADWTSYELTYEDGPRNAEGLMVDPATQRLYVVSKRASDAGVYAAPVTLDADGANVLSRVGAAPSSATDAAWSPTGAGYVVVDYVYAWLYDEVGAQPEKIVLPPRPQGETVAWSSDGQALFVGSEGTGSTVWRVPLVEAASPTPPPGDAPSSEGFVVPSTSNGWPMWPLVGGFAAAAVLAVIATWRSISRRRQGRAASRWG